MYSSKWAGYWGTGAIQIAWTLRLIDLASTLQHLFDVCIVADLTQPLNVVCQATSFCWMRWQATCSTTNATSNGTKSTEGAICTHCMRIPGCCCLPCWWLPGQLFSTSSLAAYRNKVRVPFVGGQDGWEIQTVLCSTRDNGLVELSYCNFNMPLLLQTLRAHILSGRGP